MKTCLTCHKRREEECSHVDCPNRHPVTAQLCDGYLAHHTHTAPGTRDCVSANVRWTKGVE